MKKMLGRAAAVAAGAMMLVGLGATGASAHVAAGQVGGSFASGDDPVGFMWNKGFAVAGDVAALWKNAAFATDETGGQTGGALTDVGGHHMG
jgi:hypothetical protein